MYALRTYMLMQPAMKKKYTTIVYNIFLCVPTWPTYTETDYVNIFSFHRLANFYTYNVGSTYYIIYV